MYILEQDYREILKKISICPNLLCSRNVTFLQEETSPRFPWQRLLDKNSVEASIHLLSLSLSFCSPQNGLRLTQRVKVSPQSMWSQVQCREGTGSHSTPGHTALRAKEPQSSCSICLCLTLHPHTSFSAHHLLTSQPTAQSLAPWFMFPEVLLGGFKRNVKDAR